MKLEEKLFTKGISISKLFPTNLPRTILIFILYIIFLLFRYASLFFCFGIDWNDNELSGLEVLHKYVECLDQYFGNVCELDIIYNYSAVRAKDTTCNFGQEKHKDLLILIGYWVENKQLGISSHG